MVGLRCLMAIAGAVLVVGCGSDSSVGVVPDDSATPLAAGATIPLGTSVLITDSATYPLAAGAVSIRTRCTGRVDITIETIPGSPVTNTCESPDGSSSQLNSVAGVDSVIYELQPDASAVVTLN